MEDAEECGREVPDAPNLRPRQVMRSVSNPSYASSSMRVCSMTSLHLMIAHPVRCEALSAARAQRGVRQFS